MEKLEDIIRTPIFCQIAIFALQFAICLFEIELVRCTDSNTFFFKYEFSFQLKLATDAFTIYPSLFVEYYFVLIQFDDLHGWNDIFDNCQLFTNIFCDHVNH